MPKPKWEVAQEDFIAFFPRKNQFVFQFHDARAAMGAAGSRRVFTTEHPSDFHVTDDGEAYYAEVKSCSDKASFSFANVQKGQWRAATRVVAANGLYFFFIKSEVHGLWYKIPGHVMLDLREHSGRASVRWVDIEIFIWKVLK